MIRRASAEAIERVVCAGCGTVFSAHRCHRRRFCSRQCSDAGRVKTVHRGEAHPQWKGGTDYRRRALQAHGAYCHSCGYDKEPTLLWVHHKDFSRSNHDLENLVVLCIRCHLELHLERDRAIQL